MKRSEKKRWFRLFGMDFLGSRRVLPMNIAQRGAYMQLLMLAWDDPSCSLPADEQELKRMALWAKKWGSFECVRDCFTDHPDVPGRLYNARLYEEWKYCQDKSESARESAYVRHHKKPAELPAPRQAVRLSDRSSKGFESVSAIADKHFKPLP